MNIRVLALAALIILSFAALGISQANQVPSDKTVPISGTIEVTDVRVSFRVPGLLIERGVREGEKVSEGQLIARLDPRELDVEIALRTADQEVAKAALAELQRGSEPEEVSQARSKVTQAQADLQRQETDHQRQEELLKRDVISQREFDVSHSAYQTAKAQLESAKKALSLIQRGTSSERLDQAEARLQQATQALTLAQIRRSYADLQAPHAGFVLSTAAEKGEYVVTGAPVMVIGNLDDIWLRAYISERDLGRVRLGDAVEVSTDSFPGKTYQGRVSFISGEAEFTPKNVQTADERVKLVYRIKVNLDNTHGELKPGMPAEGLIQVNQPL